MTLLVSVHTVRILYKQLCLAVDPFVIIEDIPVLAQRNDTVHVPYSSSVISSHVMDPCLHSLLVEIADKNHSDLLVTSNIAVFILLPIK